MTGSYHDLICQYAPRPIKSEADYDEIQALIDTLLDLPQMTGDQQDFLTLLSLLIQQYEDVAFSAEAWELRGVDLIRALLKEQGLRQKDLIHIFKTESIVSAVLNRHRNLTVEQIDGLATFFDLPHGYFFEPIKPQTQT